MSWGTAPRIRRAMGNTGRSRSNSSSHGDYPHFMLSGELATMRLHSKKRFWALLGGAALLIGPAFVDGQDKPKVETPDAGEAVFSSDTRLVPLNVTVTDKSGHLVTDLPRAAFTIMENGVPQVIKDFKREDVPVSIGLIIDNSGSMRDKRQAVE